MKIEGMLAFHDLSGFPIVCSYYKTDGGEGWIGEATILCTKDGRHYVEGVLLNPIKISPMGPGQHPVATAQYTALVDLSKKSRILI